MKFTALVFSVLAALVVGCQTKRASADKAGEASQTITAEELMQHIRVLASDEFEGRAPGTKGEKLTVDYLTTQFHRAGLQPGNPDGTFVQTVPLVGISASNIQVAFRAGAQTLTPEFPTDVVVWTKRFVPEVEVKNSEMVFVGYGVVAPEYNWDDFKGVDVRGKTVVFLVNDPPVPDPNDPAKLDDATFKGRAMTYYGRWTYKFEMAAAKGAAAALVVHETGPAGYPWAVVMGSNSRENFDLETPDRNMGRAAVEGWMTVETARRLFGAAGHDYDKLKAAAISRSFKPVPLGATATVSLQNTMRRVQSQNVIAKLPGADPRLHDEFVIYTAHWDHLGRDASLEGDQIFNGARDNASGTAALLEIAEAFKAMTTPPARSLVFLAVTAEEKGLLGAKHYARNPLYPIDRTVANINMDALNPHGRTRDVNVIGYGQTTIENVLAEAAAMSGRTLVPDTEPEKGRYFRSDHFEFAKVGVPALYMHGGADFIGRPAGYGKRKSDEYTARDYHKVSDEVRPDWDLSGMAEDARLLFEVGRRVANTAAPPEWKPGSEFRHLRPGAVK